MIDYIIKHTDNSLTIAPAIIRSAQSIKDFKLIVDTEYCERSLMSVEGVGLYSPELNPNTALSFTRDALTDDFNPVLLSLKYAGVNCKLIDSDSLEQLGEQLGELSENFIEPLENETGRKIRSKFNCALDSGYFDLFLNCWQLPRESLKLQRTRANGEIVYSLELRPPSVTCTLLMFFAPADLFKIWGQAHQSWLLESKLYQYRSLRFIGNQLPSFFLSTDSGLVELKIELRDCMYRLPPVDKSLAGQARAFGLLQGKLEIVNRETSLELGLSSPDDIMGNIDLLYSQKPDIAKMYNAQDIFLTNELDLIQQKFSDLLRDDFNLESEMINDTTGKNVNNIIKGLIYNHFALDKKDKTISQLFKLSSLKNLQNIPSNHFGIDSFLTVGGLLFSRVALKPIIKGLMGDLDLKSCYATTMSSLNVYYGEPKSLAIRYKKYKPKLSEAISFINSQNCPKDAWFIRVSGKFEKVFNTLVMSDLRFNGKRNKVNDKYSIPTTRKIIEQFNAEKTGKQLAESCILLKEVKFGLINHSILKVITDVMPSDWCQEYLDLSVDCIVYYPNEMICNSVSDYQSLYDSLPLEPEIETLNQDKLALETQTQSYKNNACLAFPIGEYWTELRKTRNAYKKQKNSVQEVYKIVGNSGYGALACAHLSVNNAMAANQITASARVGCWLMTYALNGCNPITDGTVFCWDNVPTNKSFKDILSASPEYIYNFSDSLDSGLNHSELGQGWIDNNFKTHLASFYGLSENHELLNQFDYELKTEKFISSTVSKKLNSWIDSLDFKPTNNEIEKFINDNGGKLTTDKFTGYVNTNAGNYVKLMGDSSILVEGTDYDFNAQAGEIKARSYSSKRDSGLLDWFVKSASERYESPYLYSENNVIKFGDGNALAIKYLEQLKEPIAHPMGFSTKAYKAMKLISRSQFLFLNQSQLRNFERNEETLSKLSNAYVIGMKKLLDKSFWDKLTNADLIPYDCELIENIDYYNYAKNHPVGVGFELLCFNRGYDNSIQKVREFIQNKIMSGCKNFNADLNINRSVKHGQKFKFLLASIIVKRLNAEVRLKNRLVKSASEPTIFTVRLENVNTIAELWGFSDSD